MTTLCALLLAASVSQASVCTNSFLGTSSRRIPANTQFLTGPTVYVHLSVRVGTASPIRVRWFRNGSLLRTVQLAGTASTAYSSQDVRAKPGQWTVVIEDGATRRSHHFVIGP